MTENLNLDVLARPLALLLDNSGDVLLRVGDDLGLKVEVGCQRPART